MRLALMLALGEGGRNRVSVIVNLKQSVCKWRHEAQGICEILMHSSEEDDMLDLIPSRVLPHGLNRAVLVLALPQLPTRPPPSLIPTLS